MKLSTGIGIIASRDIEKTLSKKILLANTDDRIIDKKTRKTGVASPADPIYFTNEATQSSLFNPDIRYRTSFGFTPIVNINYRNNLLVFSENNEIKKAVNIIANEIALIDGNTKKYPVYPKINLTQIPEDKQNVAKAIQEYLDNIFYPRIYRFFKFKNSGLIKLIKEFIITGKIAFEILYDNPKNPKEITGFIPIDPSTLQKIKIGEYVYYSQRTVANNNNQRIMHENQVMLIEWNEYDFGYVSYVDKLRVSYNIMRSMQTSKVLWFAAKSQVRMHIKLAMGDVARTDAIQKLTESKNQYVNHFTLSDDGIIQFNNKPNNSGYREFFTAETSASGSPEIEEVNTQGPDLTEVDSLQYWEKLFWKDTEIPYDRIDPNSSDSWGFTDVANLRKIEINFGKFIAIFREILNDIFLKPIIIQLTLKEVEIGLDLSLLDSIKMEWVAYNEYDKLAELEILGKRVELATNIATFGEVEDAEGRSRKSIPISWIVENYFEFTKEQLDAMEFKVKQEDIKLGFATPEGEPISTEETVDEELEENSVDENESDTAEDIKSFDDENF